MKTFKYDSRIAAIHSLRINYKSLSAEAAINRKEMRKAGPVYRSDIALHRRTYVRQEARYTNLALAYLRGIPYKAVEQKTRQWLDEKRLCKKINHHWWDHSRYRGDGPIKFGDTYVDGIPMNGAIAVKDWITCSGRVAERPSAQIST